MKNNNKNLFTVKVFALFYLISMLKEIEGQFLSTQQGKLCNK